MEKKNGWKKRTVLPSMLMTLGLVLASVGIAISVANDMNAGAVANGWNAEEIIPMLWIERSKVNGVEAEPWVWKGKEAINEALTEGTKNASDDEGSEFVHDIQWEKIGMDSKSFDTARKALEFVTEEILYKSDFENYGVAEAWTNAEQTLKKGSGDCEDKAILLASLLKFYTEDVNSEEDSIFVRVAPYQSGLHAQVIWKDSSQNVWYLLDPTSGLMNQISSPDIGTVGSLWFNDKTVKGWLSGYYQPYWPEGEVFQPSFHQPQPITPVPFHREKKNLFIPLLPDETPLFEYFDLHQGQERDENNSYFLEARISDGTLVIIKNGEVIKTVNLSDEKEFTMNGSHGGIHIITNLDPSFDSFQSGRRWRGINWR